jgi:hypothetical protein
MSPLSTPANVHPAPVSTGHAALPVGVNACSIATTITITTTTPSGWVSVRE